MTLARDQVSRADALTVTMIEKAVPALVIGRDLLDRFQFMNRGKAANAAMEEWIRGAAASLLASFASGIIADKQAVISGIVESWSNEQTQGHITKLKMTKRQMYGRRNLDLLRACLCAA